MFYVFFSLCVLDVSAQNIADVSGNTVTIDNGILNAYIVGGRMTSLNHMGGANLLANGGYGYFSYNDNEGFYSPNNLLPQVALNTPEIADIYFEHVDNFIVEMHYVFIEGESGFYTYFVTSDNNLPSKVISEIRFALRVDKDIFDYAWTVEREGPMIHPDELSNAVNEIQDATYELADGSIYTKYDWSVYRIQDQLHGLMGNGLGVWNIEASLEYLNGGPTMQDLTLHGTHTTPILLTSFHTKHYGNIGIATKDEYLEWIKIWGPAFTYVNTGSNEELVEDALLMAAQKQTEWPYEWLNDDLYPLERGSLTGTLQMAGYGEVDSAMVLLSKPPPSWYAEGTDWQRQPYDYMFWAEADANGNFLIENIRPGTYNLYAFTQKGKLINQLALEDVQVNAGENDLGGVSWEANDQAHTIFQIGRADHKSAEFKLANLPRAYGRWQETPDMLDYYWGASVDSSDWYYCQRENTEWNIHFHISNLDSLFAPTLRVALAGADANPHLQPILNGESLGAIHLGTDSAIRRSSLTSGKYVDASFSFDKSLLVEGLNTLTMNCYGSSSEYKGIMYDAVLLEAELEEPVSTTSTPSPAALFDVYGYGRQININSRAHTSSDLKIYAIGTGQLVYQGSVVPGFNVLPDFRPGQFLIQIQNEDQYLIEKVFVF